MTFSLFLQIGGATEGVFFSWALKGINTWYKLGNHKKEREKVASIAYIS